MTNPCAVCQKTVYPMEMVKIDEVVMHKTCLKCAHCNGQLSLGKYASINGKYYCKPHFKQLFALKGNYTSGFSEVDDGSSSSHGGGVYKAQNANNATPNPAPLNARTTSNLHGSKSEMRLRSHGSIEDIKPNANASAAIKNSIDNLKKAASKNNLMTRSKSDINLNTSESNSHHHKTNESSRFSKEASATVQSGSKKCTNCTKTVFPMEQIQVETHCYHKTCFRCGHCNNVLKLGNYAALDGKFFCKPHFKQLFALKGNYNEGFGTRPHKELWQPKDGIARAESVENTELAAGAIATE